MAHVEHADLEIGRTKLAVRLIRFNRAEKRNCLSLEMLDAALESLRTAVDRPVVLTGEGPIFCSGLDTGEMLRLRTIDNHLPKFGELMDELRRHPQPTACVLNGPAVGGGVGLALMTDIRVGFPGVSMSLPTDPAFRPLVGSLRTILDWQSPGAYKKMIESGPLDEEELKARGLVTVIPPGEELLESGLAYVANRLNDSFDQIPDDVYDSVTNSRQNPIPEKDQKRLFARLNELRSNYRSST